MSFFWGDTSANPWQLRFGPDALGFQSWNSSRLEAEDLAQLFASLASLRLTTKPQQRTLFVSHRRSDVEKALEVASLARQEGFDALSWWICLSERGVPGGKSSAVLRVLDRDLEEAPEREGEDDAR